MASVYSSVFPSRVAGEDLSAKQYYFVKEDSNSLVTAPDAITDRAMGVLQNAPEQGETALVQVGENTKVVASQALAIGDIVAPSANGRAQVAVSTQNPRGVVVAAASAADVIAVIRLFEDAAPLA